MIEIDAQGLFCPEPLVLVNEAIQKNPHEKIHVLVDSEPPRENITRLAKRKGLPVDVVEKDDGVISITIG